MYGHMLGAKLRIQPEIMAYRVVIMLACGEDSLVVASLNEIRDQFEGNFGSQVMVEAVQLCNNASSSGGLSKDINPEAVAQKCRDLSLSRKLDLSSLDTANSSLKLILHASLAQKLLAKFDVNSLGMMKGKSLNGIVNTVTANDVFINIGIGRDGLVPKKEIRTLRLGKGDRMECTIENVKQDISGKRDIRLHLGISKVAQSVSVILRAAMAEKLLEKLNASTLEDVKGGVLVGRVTGVTDKEVFVDIGLGKDGLIRKAEVRGLSLVRGDMVECSIETVVQDSVRNKLSLKLDSLKPIPSNKRVV